METKKDSKTKDKKPLLLKSSLKLPPLNIKKLKYSAAITARNNPRRTNSSVMRSRRILRILERDNFKCVKCPNIENLTIDHIDGRKSSKNAKSRDYKLAECQTLCVDCHTDKNFKEIQNGNRK